MIRHQQPQTQVVILGHGDPFVKNAYLTKLHRVLSDEGIEHRFWVWSRDPSYVPPAEVSVIFRFGKWGGGFQSIIGYLLWMCLLLVRVVRSSRETLFLCSRFDTAFPCAVSSLFKNTSFVFLDRDTISKSYQWPGIVKVILERAEAFVGRRARIHVVPGQSRAPNETNNVRVVRNTPHAEFIRLAQQKAIDAGKPDQPLRVLISGLISPARGSKWMLDTVRRLDGQEITFSLAGRLLGPDAEELAGLSNVRNLGLLSNVDALALTATCDVVWAFYDPGLEINRLAEPNKWFDCAALNVPFVTNAELSTITEFVDANACFICGYGNVEELADLTIALNISRTELEKKKRGLASMRFLPWDEAMASVLHEAINTSQS